MTRGEWALTSKVEFLVGSEISSEGSQMLGNGFWRVRDGWLEVNRRSDRKLNFGRIGNLIDGSEMDGGGTWSVSDG